MRVWSVLAYTVLAPWAEKRAAYKAVGPHENFYRNLKRGCRHKKTGPEGPVSLVEC